MTAAILSGYRRASLPAQLQALAVVVYVAVFAAFVVVGRPGLGIGQGFYIAIVLASLGGTTLVGIGAGLVAATLYEFGLLLHGGADAVETWSLRSPIHVVGYVAAGAIVGSFATRVRGMLSEALHVLDDLLHLARRDPDTGALAAHGLDRALSTRIAARSPFTLLVGEVGCAGGSAELRRIVSALIDQLEPGAEVARIGPTQLAVLATPTSLRGARAIAQHVERIADECAASATFGWTVHPAEGTDGWTLFRAANERLYARRIVRGEWAPTPVTADLVEEFSRPA